MNVWNIWNFNQYLSLQISSVHTRLRTQVWKGRGGGGGNRIFTGKGKARKGKETFLHEDEGDNHGGETIVHRTQWAARKKDEK